ncbi:uncharacterized protein LOC126271927 [Schistocerca gregaria]|uniref:uncharacterized protein LOC126271927 n=1 Tax=Schistocerca gregaria TaxID=7010 RepID=UPI00211DCF7D|nr:uncharacterized protein LOC126271927 [Schistocerca gregaria]
MEWNRKSIQLLIQAYKDEPSLFDHRHPQYHLKANRKEKLAKVAQRVGEVLPGVTANDCKSKFATLRSHYGAELKKMRTGKETGVVYSPTVWWFPLMEFLKNRIVPRSSHSNIPERFFSYKPQAVSMDSSHSSDLMDCYNLSDGPQLQIVESRSTEDTADSGSDNHSEFSTEIVEVKTEIDVMPSECVTTETQDAPEPPETHHLYAETQRHYEKPSKRQKKDDDDTLLLSTLSVLEKVSSYLDRTTEDDTLGKFVAEELRKMDNYFCIKTRAKHRILQAIMDAQMEIIREIQKTKKSNMECSNCTK